MYSFVPCWGCAHCTDPIRKAASIIQSNMRDGRIPDDGFLVLSSAPYQCGHALPPHKMTTPSRAVPHAGVCLVGSVFGFSSSPPPRTRTDAPPDAPPHTGWCWCRWHQSRSWGGGKAAEVDSDGRTCGQVDRDGPGPGHAQGGLHARLRRRRHTQARAGRPRPAPASFLAAAASCQWTGRCRRADRLAPRVKRLLAAIGPAGDCAMSYRRQACEETVATSGRAGGGAASYARRPAPCASRARSPALARCAHPGPSRARTA